jgi:hypothetical protein
MSKNRLRQTISPILACLVITLAALRADAHALGAECKINGARVDLESYFEDDSPARRARVRVEDEDNELVAEGNTDDQGRWSFDRPAPGNYLVVVDAGAGHRTQCKLRIPGTTASPESSRVSDGANREEFTAYPWLKIGIGLAVIGGLALAFLISRKIG